MNINRFTDDCNNDKVIRTHTKDAASQITVPRRSAKDQILMKLLHQMLNDFRSCERNSFQSSASKLHERHCEGSDSICLLSKQATY